MSVRFVNNGMGCYGLKRIPDGRNDNRTLKEIMDIMEAQPWKGMWK